MRTEINQTQMLHLYKLMTGVSQLTFMTFENLCTYCQSHYKVDRPNR